VDCAVVRWLAVGKHTEHVSNAHCI
jgi:hypothetical protein